MGISHVPAFCKGTEPTHPGNATSGGNNFQNQPGSAPPHSDGSADMPCIYWYIFSTILRVSGTYFSIQLYFPVLSSWRYPLLCIGLADLIGISAASVCVVSLSLLCTSLSYAVWRFDHMQRATLELALASEAIYSQVQFA